MYFARRRFGSVRMLAAYALQLLGGRSRESVPLSLSVLRCRRIMPSKTFLVIYKLIVQIILYEIADFNAGDNCTAEDYNYKPVSGTFRHQFNQANCEWESFNDILNRPVCVGNICSDNPLGIPSYQ